MLVPSAPMSNTERQRQFRERNPGYYARHRRAERSAIHNARWVEQFAAAQAQVAIARREPLMLPAPVEVLEIPGMNAIPASMPVREAVAVPLTAGAATSA